MLTRKHKMGDANPNLPLNYFTSEDGRSITIIDSIDSVMSAFIIHNINEINKTDQYILDGKSYFVELAVGNLVDEEGNEILDDDNNPLQDFYEEKITERTSYHSNGSFHAGRMRIITGGSRKYEYKH